MKNIEKLQNMASSYNEKTKLQNEKILGRSIRKNIELLEQAIEYAATHGRYEAMSDNLCDPRYRKGSAYSQEEMEKLMRDALIKHFTALGFSCKGQLSNYLTISWAEEKK